MIFFVVLSQRGQLDYQSDEPVRWHNGIGFRKCY